MARNRQPEPQIEPRVFRSPEDIDRGIAKLNRRIEELDHLDTTSSASQPDEPAEEEVAIELLHELALAAHRVKDLNQ